MAETIDVAAFEAAGWGRELALLGAAGYRCVLQRGDDLPTSIFARAEDRWLCIIHGGDFKPPDDDSRALMLDFDEFEAIAAATMGLMMSVVGEEEANGER